MALWAGRFSKEVDEGVNAFNSSIAFDARMYKQDIEGSIAHAIMLGEVGIITQTDSVQLVDGLQGILADIEQGKLEIDQNAEDIHMFIEAELTKRLGSVGKRLHTARSRNDQVALDLRLYLLDEIEEILSLVRELAIAFCDISAEHTETVMPGYTHLQRAQPITFAHHLMAYANMLVRDTMRFMQTEERMRVSPLGSGALAGTTYPIERIKVAQKLKLDGVTQNSLDSVSDRDFAMELASDIAICMVHLSRLSEEIILWCSWEFKFIELDDAFATGSSIMPQKKNPDITELVRGKTGRVIGDVVTLMTMMKGLPLAYNKDMQEDKEAIFDAVDTLKLCVKTVIPMLKTMRVNKENMRNAAAKGFINATDCADYLVGKSMPFRDAYKVTGGLVALCIEQGVTLETLSIEDYKAASDLFEEDIFEVIDLERCVRERKSLGGPAPDEVKRQIEQIRSLYE